MPWIKGKQYKSAIIIGGANSLKSDYEKLPDANSPVAIACNHHWVRLGMTPDYMIFFDDPNRIKILNDAINKFTGETISRCGIADIVIDTDTRNRIGPGDTGLFATWFGLQITSGNVYLCGFDCYKDILKPKAVTKKMLWWRNFFLKFGSERITPMSGPLITIIEECNGKARINTNTQG